MAKRVLFQPKPVRYDDAYYAGAIPIELETSEASILKFHVFRTTYTYRRSSSYIIMSGDALPGPMKAAATTGTIRNSSNGQNLMVYLSSTLNDALKQGMLLYDRLRAVLSANTDSVDILLEGKTIGNAKSSEEVP